MMYQRFRLFFLLPVFAATAMPAFAGADDTFTLSASAQDFDTYFPSYLANGYFSTMTAPRGTEGNLAYMVAFMDYAKDDESRPAAIPGWSEIDYSTGDSAAGHFWMNQVPVNAALFKDYRQTLNMKEATLTTSYRYVDHRRSTQIKVTTFVSQAATHLAATQISLTPDFDGTIELSFALNLWAPHQPRLPLARMTGEQMQEAVAANNMQLVAIPPATPDRAAVWYHGDTHVLASNGDVKALTLALDGRAEQGLSMAEAAAVQLPDGVVPSDIALYKSEYRLALNLKVKVQKDRTYLFTKFVAA
jgi:protein-glucosylgalactosylhydroxylysine glucosidase